MPKSSPVSFITNVGVLCCKARCYCYDALIGMEAKRKREFCAECKVERKIEKAWGQIQIYLIFETITKTTWCITLSCVDVCTVCRPVFYFISFGLPRTQNTRWPVTALNSEWKPGVGKACC